VESHEYPLNFAGLSSAKSNPYNNEPRAAGEYIRPQYMMEDPPAVPLEMHHQQQQQRTSVSPPASKKKEKKPHYT